MLALGIALELAGQNVGLAGCQAAQEPSHVELLELTGTPYERGFQHGQAVSSKLRSLYTQLLATSILPYLNRERPSIADFLLEYQDERYDDGQFSYLIFLESAQSLEATIPAEYLEELHGLADGADVPYEQVLILNTFMDTLVAFRAITYFLRDQASPHLTRVTFEGAEADGVDNDGDGEADEPGESAMEFEPAPYVARVEIPIHARLRLCLEDKDGVDPTQVRLQTPERAFVPGDEGVGLGNCGAEGAGLEVTLQPPGGFPPAAYTSLIVSAGDTTWITDPPPAKANMAREVRLGFTTAGFGKAPWEVPERSFDDGRSQPGPFGFAARGSATTDGAPLLAHHFSLLDSNTAHKHTALLVHRPDDGLAHVTLGWTGAVFGYSGMNEAGLAYAANPCDSLDNPLVAELREHLILAKLLSSGVPMGLLGRDILTHASSVAEALERLRGASFTFGWCFLLADAQGDLALVEADSDILGDGTGFRVLRPESEDPADLDPHGRRLGGEGPDDLRLNVHFRLNPDDLDLHLLNWALRPQRYWTNYYFRSVRSHHLLGEAMRARLGSLDAAAAQELLALPELVDSRDSMNAAVMEPARGLLHYALGQVPATDGPFHTLDLHAPPGEVLR
jgi:hypothetical protein